MCGIIGYLGKGNAIDIVLRGLKRLEYRGYDSAGVAFFNGGDFEIRRCKGKIRDLEALIQVSLNCNLAVGHTRWATHGVPADHNAHPHCSDSVVLVHNGIIENYLVLKEELTSLGYQFTSETDTEVIVHLIEHFHRDMPLEEAVREATGRLHGAFALVVVSRKTPDMMVGVRKDSPLVMGISEDGYFLASDVPAFLEWTRRVVFLEDSEMAVVTPDGYRIVTFDGREVHRSPTTVDWTASMADKGGYRHYMLKEIHEQPSSIANTLRGRIDLSRMAVNPGEFMLPDGLLTSINRVFIVACGTSWHAGLVGKYMIESLCRIPVEVDLASEFRYRRSLISRGDLFVVITQSGETADTLAAQREAKRQGAFTLSICNVIGSSSAREADAVFYLHSGPEIGVASTKAFTSQLVALYLFSLLMAEARGQIDSSLRRQMLQDVMGIPEKVEGVLKRESEIEEMARRYSNSKDFLYLGRGILYPVALEGALKLKEICYIHAEGYPAGEMKHGPIALIDEQMPTVFLVQAGELRRKVFSNIEEVTARGGRVIVFKSEDVRDPIPSAEHIFEVPRTNEFLEPVLMAVPLQLLAYYIGVRKGYDVDQPRNLAKSVTVE